jgi:ubiquinone/menaquinone biosynthesis C-methylase UbiE
MLVGTQRLQNGNLDAKISQEQIGFVYDKLSGIYDIWGRLTESRARSRAIELASITDGENILEVAVGTGLAFYEIVKRNPHGNNIGIDLSKGMLEKAKHRMKKMPGANYRLTVGTAFDLPTESESVDVLVNNYMFDRLT